MNAQVKKLAIWKTVSYQRFTTVTNILIQNQFNFLMFCRTEEEPIYFVYCDLVLRMRYEANTGIDYVTSLSVNDLWIDFFTIEQIIDAIREKENEKWDYLIEKLLQAYDLISSIITLLNHKNYLI